MFLRYEEDQNYLCKHMNGHRGEEGAISRGVEEIPAAQY
jgi:hypothetical protein